MCGAELCAYGKGGWGGAVLVPPALFNLWSVLLNHQVAGAGFELTVFLPLLAGRNGGEGRARPCGVKGCSCRARLSPHLGPSPPRSPEPSKTLVLGGEDGIEPVSPPESMSEPGHARSAMYPLLYRDGEQAEPRYSTYHPPTPNPMQSLPGQASGALCHGSVWAAPRLPGQHWAS